MRFFLVVFLSTACLMSATAPPAVAQARPLPSVLDFIALWLDANYQLGMPASHPDVIALPHRELVLRRYGDNAGDGAGDVVALYDTDLGAILVSEGWTGRSPADLSVLVHEMVHHLQDAAGTVFACPAAREKTAYHAQNEWLRLFDQDLESAFGIDPALILVATVCVH